MIFIGDRVKHSRRMIEIMLHSEIFFTVSFSYFFKYHIFSCHASPNGLINRYAKYPA